MDDQDYFFPAAPPTPLRRLHEDSSAMKDFSAFVDITEAEQARLLASMSGEEATASLESHLRSMSIKAPHRRT